MKTYTVKEAQKHCQESGLHVPFNTLRSAFSKAIRQEEKGYSPLLDVKLLDVPRYNKKIRVCTEKSLDLWITYQKTCKKREEK